MKSAILARLTQKARFKPHSDLQHCAWILSGAELKQLMRVHKCTIRELAKRTGFTMKRIRQIRESGLNNPHAARDWIEAVTGVDPGNLAT